jgi:hypothetical protein
MDQGLESLRQSRVRDVALVLVELAGGEEPAWRNKHLVQLVDHGGFADAGISGYEHELRGPLRQDPVERCEQYIDFALSPVQFSRDQQSIWRIVGTQRE